MLRGITIAAAVATVVVMVGAVYLVSTGGNVVPETGVVPAFVDNVDEHTEEEEQQALRDMDPGRKYAAALDERMGRLAADVKLVWHGITALTERSGRLEGDNLQTKRDIKLLMGDVGKGLKCLSQFMQSWKDRRKDGE